MKKSFIIIGFTGLILLIVGIVLLSTNNDNKKEEKPFQPVDGKEEKIIHYECEGKSSEMAVVKIKNLYVFDYVGSEVKNFEKQFIVTYENRNEYEEAFYNSYFEENDPVDFIREDEETMTRTYVWGRGPQQDSSDKSIDNYLKTVESMGYKCNEIK